MAIKRQRPSGRGVHRHADLRPPYPGRQEPGAGRRRVQVHLAAALPAPAQDLVSGLQRF